MPEHDPGRPETNDADSELPDQDDSADVIDVDTSRYEVFQGSEPLNPSATFTDDSDQGLIATDSEE